MKVYLVYAYTEDENGIIDKIFDTKRKAYDYVIKEYYSEEFYRNMRTDWLDNNASKFVAEKELE
jgi:hypothetical protein